MDIALKLKRTFAVVAAVALFATTAAPAIAQTFNDVSTDAWYYEYVEQLVDDGVVDPGDNYRPGDALNRAELTKMVITSIEGLAGYEAPATPTFDDVAADAWYYDYIEAAVQLGIVNGYTDASGNLTGMFGPADTVNRAASTKILVNAFSVPTDLDPASIFPDVASGAWYYDYVVTAFNQSILDGYANGYFGPADPVTRAQVAKLMVNAQDPSERVASEEEEEEEEEETVTSEGDLEVSLNDDTSASSTVPISASSVDLLAFDFTAADDDVEVSNVVVTRGGVGQVGDWSALYLYDGTTRLTSGRTLNSDTNTATFPVSIVVEAGTTTTITVVGDMDSSASANNQHYFYVATAADVTSNAQAVAGDFPVAGNTFTTGSVSVETLTATVASTPSSPQIGAQDVEISAFRLSAGSSNDIALHQITVTQNGTLAASKMVNLRLLRGSDEVATADGFDGSTVTFVLDTPFPIARGQTKTFYIRGDIDGGRSTDTIELYLDENTDLIAIDQQYGFGAVISNSTFTILGVSAITLKGGKVTITYNGPSASQVASNSTNLKFLDYSVAADRDLSVKNTKVIYTITDGTNTPDWSGTAGSEAGLVVTDNSDDTYTITVASTTLFTPGDMVQYVVGSTTFYGRITAITGDIDITVYSTSTIAGAGTFTEVNVYSYIKNLKIVDLDSGSTVAGPLTYASSGTSSGASNTTYSKVYTEDYDLTGGDARHLSIQFDTHQNLVAGYQMTAQVQYNPTGSADNYVKDMDANEYVSDADIVGANLTSKTMTAANNSLTVSLSSTPTSQTYVKGEDNVSSVGIAFKAGDAGPITLKKVTVRLYADTTATAGFSANGDTAANTIVSSVTLYDGNDVAAEAESLSLVNNTTTTTGFDADGNDYYKVVFEDLNLEIPAGSTKTYVAKVKLLNTMSSTTYLALDIDPNDDVEAEDSDDNSVTASPTSGLNHTAGAHDPELTVGTAGTLKAYSESNPDAAIAIEGTSEMLVAKYRFHALQEGFNVNKLTVMNDASGVFDTAVPTSAVADVTIKYPDVNGVTQTKTETLDSDGTITLSGLGMYVPKDDDATLEIYANVNTRTAVGEVLSGKTFRLGIQDTSNSISTFEAVGEASSTTDYFDDADEITNQTAVKTFLVRNTSLKLAKSTADTKLINNENSLYAVTVLADSANGATLSRIVFDLTTSGMSSGGAEDLHTFRLLKNGSPMSTSDVNIYGTNSAGGNAVELQATAAGSALDAADGNAANGLTNTTYKIIVSFDEAQTITEGSSAIYTLKAMATGADGTDAVTVRLSVGDEDTAVSGKTTATNANTAKVYSATAASALFSAASSDVAQLLGTARNIIWSDQSSNDYSYPTIASGVVTADSGSYDYTNGYLLKITNVASNSLEF